MGVGVVFVFGGGGWACFRVLVCARPPPAGGGGGAGPPPPPPPPPPSPTTAPSEGPLTRPKAADLSPQGEVKEARNVR
ncbi:hypothetical protein ABIB57_004672 [Devosia sp. UYZn731]